jgi:hypothetical protein
MIKSDYNVYLKTKHNVFLKINLPKQGSTWIYLTHIYFMKMEHTFSLLVSKNQLNLYLKYEFGHEYVAVKHNFALD